MGWKSIEKRRAYLKEWVKKDRKKNPERYQNYVKKSQQKCKEKKKVYMKIYELENKEKIKERNKKWKNKNKEKIRDQNLKRMYGISSLDYENILESQHGKCCICLIHWTQTKENRKLVVDHCHTTGKIRGLLCMNCNKSLGFLKDNKEIISNMLIYISKNL